MKKELDEAKLLASYFEHNARVEETLQALRVEGYTFAHSTIRKRLREALRRSEAMLEKSPSGSIDPWGSLEVGDGRYFITAAQNNTSVHKQFFESIKSFCKHQNAQLLVSKMRYSQKRNDISESLWYDPILVPYLMDEQVQLGDFVFYGNVNILPTAVNPLSGLESHSGELDCAFPHTKLHMRSIATMPKDPAKHIYTTGACTLLNYIQRKSGQKAELHHVFGGLFVEVVKGKATVTPISANESDGSFQVYDKYYNGEEVSNVNAFAVNFGDIHLEKLTSEYSEAMSSVMLDLKPEHVFLHDVLDFEARNHHEVKDKFNRHKKYVNALDLVEDNVLALFDWLTQVAETYPDTLFHVVPSNHNDAFYKWANDEQPPNDYPNLEFWHLVNYLMLSSQRDGDSKRELLEIVADYTCHNFPPNVVFHGREESVRYFDIEFNLHGDMGANGSRGTPQGISKLGFKANTGHTHSAGIFNGVYVAGVSGTLEHGYNKGLSSWSNSFVVTYQNGKRTVITKYPTIGDK